LIAGELSDADAGDDTLTSAQLIAADNQHGTFASLHYRVIITALNEMYLMNSGACRRPDCAHS